MRIGAFELNEPLPELHRTYALVMLRPWVDVGEVGNLCLTCVEDALVARPLGRLARPGNFFDFTRYRPVGYEKEGRREIAIPNTVINYVRWQDGKDLLFLHLLEPHMLGEAYATSILKVLKTLGVERYCLIGSMYDVVPHTRPLIVSGTAVGASAEQELRSRGIQPSGYQGPTSITVLVSQEAARSGIETMSLIVHLPQYMQVEEDYGGALRLLELLCSIYHFPVNLGQAKKKADSQYEQISLAIDREPHMKQLVKEMESYYDARTAKAEEEAPRLSPEVEKFLREIDRRFGKQ